MNVDSDFIYLHKRLILYKWVGTYTVLTVDPMGKLWWTSIVAESGLYKDIYL